MKKFTDKIDMRFTYTPSAESAKSGYLARRFAAIRKQQAEEAARKLAEAEAEKAVALDIEAEVQRKVRRLAK